MSIVEIKMAFSSFADINFVHVGVVALLIFVGIYFLMSIKAKMQGQKLNASKLVGVIALAIYLTFLRGGTILGRVPGEDYQMKYTPFWSYIHLLEEKNYNLLRQMISNVLVFIPWPILFAHVFPAMRRFRWAVGSAFVFSACIEVTQLVFKLGLFEFDDMFHNTLGAVIGYSILKLYKMHKQKGIEE